MQSRATGGVIAAGLIVVAVVLFVVLRNGGDDNESTTTPVTTTQATEQEKPRKPKPEPKPVTIVVEGGQPVGGVQELEFTHGDDVRFQVRSDAPDEVHLHGYDIEEPVAPGEDAKFDFVADIEGGFELELHGSATQIAELTVEPS
jgi:hypothetical protein